MTPEYHYAVAESILAQADGNDDLTMTEAGVLFARAQVHATLGSVDMNGAEIEKLRAENARLNRVIDEKVRDHNEEAEVQERIGKALADAHVFVHYDSCTDEFIVENKAADENKLLREVAGYPKEATDGS